VRLLFDALGSKNTSPRFIEAIRRTGVRAEPFRPLRLLPIEVFPRDHARIVLLDDVAYTGGSAWGDEWLPVEEGGKGWHDVCVRLRGPCIRDLARIFEQRWRHRGTRDATPPESPNDESADVTVVADLARGTRRIYDAHLAAVRRAKRRVWIENSYFLPPEELLRELVTATRRGVDVRILLPGESDLPTVAWAARGEYARWIASGLDVLEYQASVMHAKIAVVDDDWCTIGTFNINAVSMACAHELNVFVREHAFVETVAAQIAHDFDQSKRMTLADVRAWPLHVRLWHQLAARVFRILEYLAHREWPRPLWGKVPAPGHRLASSKLVP
jgi:cardiolipin synthase